MHRVGFEPTSFATSHLECDPLDRSGIYANCFLTFLSPFIPNVNLQTKKFTFIKEMFLMPQRLYFRKSKVDFKFKMKNYHQE